MLREITHREAQALLRQRNVLAVVVVGLFVLNAWVLALLGDKHRDVVLVPTLERQVTLSSRGVTPDYLELMTRDVAFLMLNRSPRGVDYWLDQVLQLVDPAHYGRIKASLVKLVDEARGSNIAQSFQLHKLTVNPTTLESEIWGELTTIVGTREVMRERKQFRVRWSYQGLRLALIDFTEIVSSAEAAP